MGWFSSADLARLKSGGTRWEKTARWAISNLKKQRFIEAVAKNQYQITPQGADFLKTRPFGGKEGLAGMRRMIPTREGRPVRLDSNIPL